MRLITFKAYIEAMLLVTRRAHRQTAVLIARDRWESAELPCELARMALDRLWARVDPSTIPPQFVAYYQHKKGADHGQRLHAL